jgi:2-amino-4-hydroxy-6-hydroxymethyldihydropteridine diphosphokinase
LAISRDYFDKENTAHFSQRRRERRVLKIVYLGLGSNVGDREGWLRKAVDTLQSRDMRILRMSPVYETEPQGRRNQNWFLNAVAEAETELFPLQLLRRIGKIEKELGRKRIAQNAPRTIDIDILFYGNAVVSTAALEIPHPRLRERRFVLAPLADLAPDLRDPVTRRTIRELLAATAGQSIRKVDVIIRTRSLP